MVRNAGRVTRFVVMATLQAARARLLGLSESSAYSWGLNRAIFYAAAKRGFSEGPSREAGQPTEPERARALEYFRLGSDEAQRVPGGGDPLFTIGDQIQTPDRFERDVKSRFGTQANFLAAWEEATRILREFDRSVLESGPRFYESVYKPRRDDLSDTWTEKYSPPKESTTKRPARPKRAG